MDQPTEAVFSHLRAIADQAFKLIHDLDARRKLIERYFCVHPSTMEIQGQWYPVKNGSLALEWVVADGADPNRRILYLHGGSWISGSPAGYRAFLSRVSQASGAVVLAVDYRLAPEHKFPAALEDCTEAYRWMRQHGPGGQAPTASAYLMGDSAGGNLALATLLKARDLKLTLPEAVVAISPATDFTGGSPSLVSRAAVDPIITSDPVFVAATCRRNDRAVRNVAVRLLSIVARHRSNDIDQTGTSSFGHTPALATQTSSRPNAVRTRGTSRSASSSTRRSASTATPLISSASATAASREVR